MKKVHFFTRFLLVISISWSLTLNHSAFAEEEECDPNIEQQPNGGACPDNDACKCVSGICVNGTCRESLPNNG